MEGGRVRKGLKAKHQWRHTQTTCTSIYSCRHMYTRQLIFLRKNDCLGCAVLLCLVCLFDLACFFLPSFSSLIKTCTCTITPVAVPTICWCTQSNR